MSKSSPLSGGYTYLMIAAEEGDLDKVRAILPSQQINAKNQAGYSALALAIKNRQLEVAKYLISKNADVNSCNNAGQSIIFLACWNDCIDGVQILLAAGADLNIADQRGWTPLIISAYHNYLGIVKVLVASGANIEHKDSFGKQAIDRAKTSAIKEVLSAGPGALKLKLPISDYSPAISDRESFKSTPRNSKKSLTIQRNSVNSRSSSVSKSVRSSSPGNISSPRATGKNPRVPRSSSVSKSTNVQQLAPDKRRQFREEIDRHIKASANTLGTKVAENCLSSVNSSLVSEVNKAQDLLLNELASLFKKQTQQMISQLKLSVSSLLEQALTSKGLESEGVVLGDIGVEGNLKAKAAPRQSASPNKPSRTYEKLIEMPDELDLNLQRQVPESFEDLRSDLYNHIDKHMEDLTLKLHKLIKAQIASEVNSRVSRTRNYLSSVLKENLEEVSTEVRRALERSIKGKLDEVLMMTRLSVPSPRNVRVDELTVSSIDTYNSPARTGENTKLKSIAEKLPKSATNILQRIEARQRVQEDSKEEPSPNKRQKLKRGRSNSTGKLREVPVTNVGAALQQFLKP